MRYYSTGGMSPEVSLAQAVIEGLAPDRGLYMPDRIPVLPDSFYADIVDMTFKEMSMSVARAFFGEDIPENDLRRIVEDTLSFDTPLVKVWGNIYSLELFHGPTLAFKDVGARFMARLLSWFIMEGMAGEGSGKVTVLAATSGDTGSAVANGFLGVEGIDVIVLYPSGKVSDIQEKQFTTLGRNITALEVDGTFDDCQRLVKMAFMDMEVRSRLTLTSANSINVARLLPQMFYYFNAYARLKRAGYDGDIVFSVPSGNFGNLTAGLIAAGMGLPVKHFIAANNVNDVFLEYLQTGRYSPRASVRTIANAMDVGDPSNLARIVDLYKGSVSALRGDVSGCSFTDDDIRNTISEVYHRTGYVADPHGACACRGLMDSLKPGQTGVFLETAHPAKFKDTVEEILGTEIQIPERLMAFLDARKQSVKTGGKYDEFKKYLLSRC